MFRQAILATETVAQENVESRKGGEARGRDKFFERDHAGQPHFDAGRVNDPVIFRDDTHAPHAGGFDGLLPRPKGKREIAQRPEIGVENQSRTIFRRRRHQGNLILFKSLSAGSEDRFDSESITALRFSGQKTNRQGVANLEP